MAGTKETSRIEVFFNALGSERLQNAFLKNAAAAKTMQGATSRANRLANAGFTDISRGYGRLESAALRGARAVGSVGETGFNAFRRLIGTIGDASRTLLKFGGIGTAVAAGGLALIGKGIANITESGQDLQSTILSLRSLNGEINANGKLPSFSYAPRRAIAGGSNPFNGPDLSSASFGGNTRDLDRQLAKAGGSAAKSLNFLSGGFIDKNSRDKTASDFDFLTGVADKFGQSIGPLARSYAQFRAAAQSANLNLGEQREVLLGVTSAAVQLGISTDDTNGILRALNQVASKGTLQAEELRGQIGDRLPGAFGIAARSMGVTEKELNALMKEGLIPASTFLKSFASQLTKEFGPGAESALGTTRVAAGRVANAFVLAKANIFSGEEAFDSFTAAAKRGERQGLIFGVTLDKAVGRLLNSVSALFRRLGESGEFERFGGGLAGIVERVAQAIDKSDGFVRGLLRGIVTFGNGALTVLGYVGKGFVAFKEVLFGQFQSENPVIAFFQSVRATATGLFALLTSNDRNFGFVSALTSGLRTITELLFGVARTLYAVSNGQGSTAPFQSLVAGIDRLRILFNVVTIAATSFAENAFGAISKEAAAGFPNVSRYATAIDDLFSGKATPKDGTLSVLFSLRDTITNEVVPAIVILAGFIRELYNAAVTLKPLFDFITAALFNLAGAVGSVISYIPGLGGIGDAISSLSGVDTFLEAFLILRFVRFLGLVPLVTGGFKAIAAVAIFSSAKFEKLRLVSDVLFKGFGGKAAAGAGAAFGAIKRIFLSGLTKLVPLIVAAGSSILTGLTAVITTAVSFLGTAIAFIFSPAGLIILAIAALAAVIYFYWDDIVAGAKSAFEWFTETLPTIIGDGFAAAWATVKDTAATLWKALKKGFGYVIDGILTPFHLIYDIVRKIVKATGSDLLDDIVFPTFSEAGENISKLTGEGQKVQRDTLTGEVVKPGQSFGVTTADVAAQQARPNRIMDAYAAAEAQRRGVGGATVGPRAGADFSQARNIVIDGRKTEVLMTKAGESDLERQARELAARQSGPMPQWAGQNRTG